MDAFEKAHLKLLRQRYGSLGNQLTSILAALNRLHDVAGHLEGMLEGVYEELLRKEGSPKASTGADDASAAVEKVVQRPHSQMSFPWENVPVASGAPLPEKAGEDQASDEAFWRDKQ